MQGQEPSTKKIHDDIDDQYRSLRRDVQHGRAELVRRHKYGSEVHALEWCLKNTLLMLFVASR